MPPVWVEVSLLKNRSQRHAIRSIEPFVPPMGVLSDFFGFFWAESIVAVSLVIHLYWYCRMKVKLED